jgi:hypothetical protein
VWTVNSVPPDGSAVITYGTITFYDNYNDYENCFVAKGGASEWIVYGTKHIDITWYYGRELSDNIIPTGTWLMKFFKDDEEFYSGNFTLLPEINPVKLDPLLNMLAYDDHYANVCRPAGSNSMADDYWCDGTPGEQQVRINQEGCYLTAATQILNYHGVNVTPPQLDDWLTEQELYGDYGRIDPRHIPRYAWKVHSVPIEFLGWDYCPDQLEGLIYDYGPQLVKRSDRATHHVTATGKNPERTRIKVIENVGGVWATLEDIAAIRPFNGMPDQYKDWTGMSFYFYSPGELLIENPEGLRTGYDPINGLYYNEIPGSVYQELVADNDAQNPLPLDQLPRTELLDIPRPSDGEYKLYVIGTETGTYGLDIKVWDSDLNFSQKKFRDVPITPGETHTYSYNYSRTGGSDIEIGYDGGGQRPKDVNKFLSYIRPSQRQTTLLAGTTIYNAIVAYGDSIIPSSFKAELNGLDITSLFNPVPEGTDVVALNLNQGRNKLILSVDANLTNRVANDKDTLIFMVP